MNTVVGTSNATVVLLLTHHATAMCMRALKLNTRRALAGLVRNIVTWLVDSCLAETVVVVTDCGLHLPHNLINGGPVTASLCIAHGWKAVMLHGICLAIVTASRQSRDWLISWNGCNRLLSDKW